MELKNWVASPTFSNTRVSKIIFRAFANSAVLHLVLGLVPFKSLFGQEICRRNGRKYSFQMQIGLFIPRNFTRERCRDLVLLETRCFPYSVPHLWNFLPALLRSAQYQSFGRGGGGDSAEDARQIYELLN